MSIKNVVNGRKYSQKDTSNKKGLKGDVLSVSLTLAAGGKAKCFWVLLTHPVDHIDLLQCLSHRVFVLSITRDVG